MSDKKWSDDTIMKFINIYSSLEVLWNTSLPNYKNKHSRQMAIEKIATEMNIEGFGAPEIKSKINNIRSAYCQEMKKINASKQSGISAESVYKPTVIWFNTVDSFLRKHTSQRPTQSNLVSLYHILNL